MLNRSQKTTGEIPVLAKTSIIGAGMAINGEIIADGDVRIDGKLTGKIKCSSKVVVGEEGIVEGDINALQADVTGQVIGNILTKGLLTLRNKASVSGDINAGQISMEPSVSFNGSCTMQPNTSTVVEMTTSLDERKRAAEQ